MEGVLLEEVEAFGGIGICEDGEEVRFVGSAWSEG